MQKDSKPGKKEMFAKAAGAVVDVLADDAYTFSMKEAEHYKALSVLYLAGFLGFVFVMLAFAYTLFIYDSANFVFNDGTTVWGILVVKMLIFIPLLILAWFFGNEAIKSKERYEVAIHLAFFIAAAREFKGADDKIAALKDILAIGKK